MSLRVAAAASAANSGIAVTPHFDMAKTSRYTLSGAEIASARRVDLLAFIRINRVGGDGGVNEAFVLIKRYCPFASFKFAPMFLAWAYAGGEILKTIDRELVPIWNASIIQYYLTGDLQLFDPITHVLQILAHQNSNHRQFQLLLKVAPTVREMRCERASDIIFDTQESYEGFLLLSQSLPFVKSSFYETLPGKFSEWKKNCREFFFKFITLMGHSEAEFEEQLLAIVALKTKGRVSFHQSAAHKKVANFSLESLSKEFEWSDLLRGIRLVFFFSSIHVLREEKILDYKAIAERVWTNICELLKLTELRAYYHQLPATAREIDKVVYQFTTATFYKTTDWTQFQKTYLLPRVAQGASLATLSPHLIGVFENDINNFKERLPLLYHLKKEIFQTLERRLLSFPLETIERDGAAFIRNTKATFLQYALPLIHHIQLLFDLSYLMTGDESFELSESQFTAKEAEQNPLLKPIVDLLCLAGLEKLVNSVIKRKRREAALAAAPKRVHAEPQMADLPKAVHPGQPKVADTPSPPPPVQKKPKHRKSHIPAPASAAAAAGAGAGAAAAAVAATEEPELLPHAKAGVLRILKGLGVVFYAHGRRHDLYRHTQGGPKLAIPRGSSDSISPGVAHSVIGKAKEAHAKGR